MNKDKSYFDLDYKPSLIQHHYSEKVRLIKNPVASSLLSKFSHPDMVQPMLNRTLTRLYSILLDSALGELGAREDFTHETRMKEFNEHGVLSGQRLKLKQNAVVVDLARAGILPSQLCFEELSCLIDPSCVRQDHFYVSRRTNSAGEVDGVDVSGSKIGGPKDGALVLLPDPMGATGSSLSHCISHYKENVAGKEAAFVALHLIVTPEYIQRMTKDHPDVHIFALRLDRGLSTAKALAEIPGHLPNEEKGLNEIDYIVPGAGGVGEILNNSFV